MLSTTFSLLKQENACVSGYRKLAKFLGGFKKYGLKKEITLMTVFDSNGLDDAVWCFRAVLSEQKKNAEQIARLFACGAVRETPLQDGRKVWDLLTDERSRKAVEIAENFAVGEASKEELAAAWDAARNAARDAAWAAARDAAWAAARAAAWAAARAAAWDAARDAAWDAARAAAWAAAWAAARDAQSRILRGMLQQNPSG
jgi:hypothetical protein